MKVNENDYLICRNPENPKKNFMMQVKSIAGNGNIKGTLEEDRHLHKNDVMVEKRDIIVNLGEDPAPGMIYGVDARDIYRKTIYHDGWGEVHIFTKLKKDTRIALKRSLDKTITKLDKMGFAHIVDRVHFEVRSARGKYAGAYAHKPKDGDNRLMLYLKDEHAAEMNYVVYHEAGHALRFNYVTSSRTRARWLRMFNTSVLVEPIEREYFEKVLRRLLKSGAESISDFMRAEEKEFVHKVMKTTLRFIRQVHRVSPKEINTTIKSGDEELLEELWPKRDIDANDLKPIVSEYACKSVEELWAESFAYDLIGKKIPKGVKKLLHESLDVARDYAKRKDKDL